MNRMWRFFVHTDWKPPLTMLLHDHMCVQVVEGTVGFATVWP